MVKASGRLAATAVALMLTACLPIAADSYIDFNGKITDEQGRPYKRCDLTLLDGNDEFRRYTAKDGWFSTGFSSGPFDYTVVFEASCDGAVEKYQSKPTRLKAGGKPNDVGTFVLRRAPQ